MTFEELLEEYDEKVVGEGLYGLVLELCKMVARRYPADVYNGGTRWDDEDFEDLCLEVVGDLLIDRGQIHYVFSVADSYEAVRRLLTHQIKRALASRRTIGPIDRLMRRVKQLADTGPFDSRQGGLLAQLGHNGPHIPLTPDRLRRCVDAASVVPRLVSKVDSNRESMVYTTPALLEVMTHVLNEAPCVAEQELREILANLLTPWVPAKLVPVEDHQISDGTTPDSDQEMTQVLQAAEQFAEALSHDERVLLVLKSQDVADARVAKEIGKSRPTTANLKTAVFGRLGSEFLKEIDPDHHPIALEHLIDAAARHIEDSSA